MTLRVDKNEGKEEKVEKTMDRHNGLNQTSIKKLTSLAEILHN